MPEPYTNERVLEVIATGRPHVMAVLRPGPNPRADTSVPPFDHLRYHFTLRDGGEVRLIGPMRDSPDIAGIIVFETADLDTAARLMDGDPGVANGNIVYELTTWYALPGSLGASGA